MKKGELKKRVNALNYIAQSQALSGKMMKIGEGMVSSKIGQTPFRILDEWPVYHSSSNEFDLADMEFKRDKTHIWGKFYHPFLMMGMPDVGGRNKLYVDTRINGWYILWVSTKLDEDDFGPSDWMTSIVAWTPKQKNDSITKAGYRLFWASSLALDYVEKDQLYNDDYDKDGVWKDLWSCSPSCFQVFASIRKTRYSDEREFERTLSEAPSILRTHLISRRFIT